jgi:hypothetical protein
MAIAPDHITITVDEEALRKQIGGIVHDEMKEASLALRRAADALDPEWPKEHQAWLENHLRAKWEAELAAKDEKGAEL